MLGIVCASPYEARPLTRCETCVGHIYSIGESTLLAVSGAGAEHAGRATDYLLGEGVDAILSWGFASGLQLERSAGDVVLPQELITLSGRIKVSKSWRTALRKRLADFSRVFDGPLAHSEIILNRPTDKQLLHDSSSAIAVDRESAAVASHAGRAKVAFVALKVIADAAGVRVPAVLLTQMTEQGWPDTSRILASAGPRPWQWPASFKLTCGLLAAFQKLRYIADKLERDMAPPPKPVRPRKPVVREGLAQSPSG